MPDDWYSYCNSTGLWIGKSDQGFSIVGKGRVASYHSKSRDSNIKSHVVVI